MFGRFGGLIVGVAFFIVGIASSVLRKRRNQRNMRQLTEQPNTNRNNADRAAMIAIVPPQYHVSAWLTIYFKKS